MRETTHGDELALVAATARHSAEQPHPTARPRVVAPSTSRETLSSPVSTARDRSRAEHPLCRARRPTAPCGNLNDGAKKAAGCAPARVSPLIFSSFAFTWHMPSAI